MSQDSSAFRFPIRVYYEDTDAGGIVYHSNYVNFMERGRTEMLRSAGISLHDLDQKEGIIFVVAELNAKYKASARLDDLVEVHTSVLSMGNASVTLRQNILKRVADTESLLLEGIVSLVLITREGKPVRIPPFLRDALAPYTVKDKS